VSDLLPCPFCGGAPRDVEITIKESFVWHHVICTNNECLAEGRMVGPHKKRDEGYAAAVEAWNRRDGVQRPSAPAWHQRPTGPGRWLCWGEDQSGRIAGPAACVLELSELDLKRGAPFQTSWCYGPIPAPPVKVENGCQEAGGKPEAGGSVRDG